MQASRQRVYMIAIIKDAKNRTIGYHMIDRATRKVFSLGVQQLRVDVPNKAVLCKVGDEPFVVENLHAYKKDAGVIIKGGISGQLSKYPVLNDKGQLIKDTKLSTTNRITLLAAYADKYKFADYSGKIMYLPALAVYQGVHRGRYLLTNAKIVIRDGNIIVSLLYGNLVREEEITKKSTAPDPSSMVKGTVSPKEIKSHESFNSKMAASEPNILANVNQDKLVEAINYVKDRMESQGYEIEDLDCIGIALMHKGVYTLSELRRPGIFNDVQRTVIACLNKNLHFADIMAKIDGTVFTP